MIRVPYVYDAVVRKRPKGPARRERFGAWAEIGLRVIDAAEAPKAISWKEHRQPDGVPSIPEELCITRFHQGAHWMPALICAVAGRTIRHSTAREWAWRDQRNRSFFTPFACAPREGSAGDVLDFVHGHIETIEEANPAEVCQTSAPAAEEALRKEWEGYAVIDGRLWIRSHEPTYVILPKGDHVSVEIAAHAPVDRDPFAVTGPERFAIDRHADAVDRARSSWPGLQVVACPPAEVLLADCVSYDDETEMLFMSAARLVARGHKLIRRAPIEQAAAWFDLRDKTDSYAAGSFSPEELEAAIAGYARAFAEDERSAADAVRALERWRLRPVADGHAPAP